MDVRTIETPTHGRYLVAAPPPGSTSGPVVAWRQGLADASVDPGGGHAAPMLVGFHGYQENAGLHMAVLRRIAGVRPWCLVSVQALNRFYARANDIAGNWMTREDRELAIADNIAYVAAVVAAVEREYAAAGPLFYVGFSQGVAMAYRAAAFAGRRCDGLIVLAGDVPPDVTSVAASLPPILLGRGTTDGWYTPEKAATDLALLHQAGANVTEYVFAGGHLWDQSFIDRAGAFVDERLRNCDS